MSGHEQGKSAVDEVRAAAERTSDQEIVVARTVHGPARLVWDAWTRPDLFQRWWAPASSCVRMLSKEMDVRTGGSYRLLMAHPSLEEPMTFFGRYLEATPPSRLVWTNEEGEEGGAVTTVTFEEAGEATRLVVHELYPSKAALDEAMASGSTSGWGEQFEQLEALISDLKAQV